MSITVFSENLKKLRLQKGLTQEQVADTLGVTAQSVSRWERGTTLPDVLLLPDIARLYAVTVDDLYRDNSRAYENYAQRLAAVYDITKVPADYLKAHEEFEKQKTAGTYTPEDRRLHGVLHERMMLTCRDKAFEAYQQVLAGFEKERDVEAANRVYWRTRYQLLFFLAHIGQGEEACTEQAQRLERNKTCHMEWLATVYAHHCAGDDQKALAVLQEAEQRFDGVWELYAMGADVCRAMGEYRKAIDYCDKAQALDTDFADHLYTKAKCLEALGDYAQAYEVWQEIVALLEKDGYITENGMEQQQAQACMEKMRT